MDHAGNNLDDADVWSSFEKSVAYMKEVAALYQDTFGVRGPQQPASPSSAPKQSVTKAHLDEAHNQTQQALELLASNLLNASTSVVSAIEKQEAEITQLTRKLSGVRQSIRDRQAMLDQQAAQRLRSSGRSVETREPEAVAPASGFQAQQPLSNQQQHRLELSLSPSSTPSLLY